MPRPDILTAIVREPGIGSLSELARRLTALTPDDPVTVQAVSQWAEIPPRRCEPLETLTLGKYRVEDLRSDIQWQRDPENGRVTGYTLPAQSVTPTRRPRGKRQ